MFPGMLHAWQIAEPSVKQGKSVYGIRIAFGTGGQEGASFEALEELFYNPDGYQVYSVPNVWDPGREATKCGFFIPESKNREGYYDKEGNSFVKEATEEVLQEREVIRKNSRNPLAVTYKMAESPLIPQEAILRTVGALFPVKDLKVALAELEVNHKLLDSSLKGYLIVNKDGMIEWKNSDEMPIRDFPITSNKNIHGCIEIFEPPKDGKEYGRYISGIDPYDDDESTTSSLGSCFILDVFTDRIVAEYTGRPNTAVEFYENCRRLLMYYSAECNYENNKKGLFTYFDQKHSLHLLCETPKSLRDVENIRIFDSGNKSKGTNASKEVNKYGRRLLHDWMVSQAYEKDDGIENLHLIRSRSLIQEAIAWNPDGNFDRISAMGMLMILKQDRQKVLETRRNKIQTKASDPFFSRHTRDVSSWKHRNFKLSYNGSK